MDIFEYKIIEPNRDGSPDNEFELNGLGEEGWELVAIKKGFINHNDTIYETDFFYFKRLKH